MSTATVAIYVKPGVRTPYVGGTFDGRLIVAVSSPASDGQANIAVLQAMAEALSLPARCLSISSGLASRRKMVAISSPDLGLEERVSALRNRSNRRG